MYAASWLIPRNGLAGARTLIPAACRVGMTPAQFEASANAPCTSTTVRGPLAAVGVASVMLLPSCVVTTNDRPGDEAPRATSGHIPRPAAATAAAAPAPASLPTADRRDSRPTGMVA